MPALETLDLRWNTCAPSHHLLTQLEERACVVRL